MRALLRYVWGVSFFTDRVSGSIRFLLCAPLLFFVLSCSNKTEITLRRPSSDNSLQGKAIMFASDSNATTFSGPLLSSCSDKTATLNKVLADGSIDSNSLAQSSIAGDGSFSFSEIGALSSTIEYVVVASG